MARGEIALESALNDALPKRGVLLAAVSGGADSVALLRALAKSWVGAGKTVVVAHVNHRLRSDSDLDERFVKDLSRSLGLRCLVRRLRNPPTIGIEAWAREHRYKALEGCRTAVKARWILTAHTLNDVAETFMIKLLQNRDSTLLEHKDRSRKLIRPLATINRAQIEDYLGALAQPWREDASNTDLSFARNWVRVELLPRLSGRWGGGIYRTLAERAAAQRADRLVADAFVRQLTRGSAAKLRTVKELKVKLAVLPVAGHDLFGCAVTARCFGLRIGRLHGAAVVRLILGKSKAVQLPGNRHLTVFKGSLQLRRL